MALRLQAEEAMRQHRKAFGDDRDKEQTNTDRKDFSAHRQRLPSRR